jgi:predicted choloylglycine hydrolase
VRYLLEVTDTVAAATSALRVIPVSMSYNLTMTDRFGVTRTAYVAPGRPPEIRGCPVATNHRFDRPDDPEHAARLRSVERRRHLDDLLARQPHPDQLAEEFLRRPLRNVDFQVGFGTLYTADYRPDARQVHYRWPGTTWTRTFNSSDAELRIDIPTR